MTNIVNFDFKHYVKDVSYNVYCEILVENYDTKEEYLEVVDVFIEPVTLTEKDINLSDDIILDQFNAWVEMTINEMVE